MNAIVSPLSAIIARTTLAELSPVAVAGFTEAQEYFASGKSIHNAAMDYAGAADRYYFRVLTFAGLQGLLSLPANDKGKAPKFEALASISSDSKNAARAYAQEVVSLAWRIKNDKGLDPFAFASMSSLRAAARAKDKVVENPTNESGIVMPEVVSPEAQAEQDEADRIERAAAVEAAVEAAHNADTLTALREELSKAKPSVATLRKICGM
jgi:hypothetical protein